MCENSEVRFACRNFRFDLSNVKINPAGDHSRETAIEKTILRVPRARAFLHRLGHFRPIDGVFAMSAVHSISTELLHYGNPRSGPQRNWKVVDTTVLIPGVLSKIRPRNCPDQSYVRCITDSGPAPGVGG
jgi:hypothetical protein